MGTMKKYYKMKYKDEIKDKIVAHNEAKSDDTGMSITRTKRDRRHTAKKGERKENRQQRRSERKEYRKQKRAARKGN